jgi:hypothetical protein
MAITRRMLPPRLQSLSALHFVAEHGHTETFPVIFSWINSDACFNMADRAEKHYLIKLACTVYH